jgi:lysophospholipase L1-like esterase
MQWVTAGAAAAFAATNPPAAGITANLSLDIRLEYECQTTRRTLLAIGDSITIGWPGPTITSCQPHEAWPGVAGLQNNCPWVNMGAGGTSTVDWTTFTGWRWQRVDLATSPPEVAIIALGTNDFVGAVTPGTALTNVCNTAKQLLSIGVAEVWGASVLPRGLTAGNETNRVTFNNNLAELPAGFVRYIDFDKALTAGIGGSAGAPNADPDFISTPAANPHPQNRGYQRMGSMIML